MAFNNMHIKENFPTAADVLAIPIAKFITISANGCGYSGTSEELMANFVHTLLINFN